MADRIAIEKGILTLADVESFLKNDLRFYFNHNLKSKIVTTIADIYCKKALTLLAEYLKELEKS